MCFNARTRDGPEASATDGSHGQLASDSWIHPILPWRMHRVSPSLTSSGAGEAMDTMSGAIKSRFDKLGQGLRFALVALRLGGLGCSRQRSLPASDGPVFMLRGSPQTSASRPNSCRLPRLRDTVDQNPSDARHRLVDGHGCPSRRRNASRVARKPTGSASGRFASCHNDERV